MYYLHAIYSQLSDKFGRIRRKLWRNKYERSKLTNTDFTIFSQNCIGGIMYHDLGLRFRSPTVNMLFSPKDFIQFMKDIHWHLEQEIKFLPTDESYPIGVLGNIEISFLHYHSEEEVLQAWNSRKERINLDNIFVICCDEGLTYEDMKVYDALPYEHKILFVSKPHPDIKCAVVCHGMGNHTDASLLNFANPMGKRYYQKYINYVDWLNCEGGYLLHEE